MAKWIAVQSELFSPAILPVSRKCISSAALAAGPTPAALPVGPTTDLFGQVRVPVSRSAPRDAEVAPTTHGTCGPTSYASSVPSGPLWLLENKLRARLAMVGSTEFKLIWRERVTPAGALISRLAPWTPRISGPGSTGAPSGKWATPTLCGNYNRKGSSPTSQDGIVIQMRGAATWPTPTVADVTGGRKTRSGMRNNEPLMNGLMHGIPAPSGQTMNGSPATTARRGVPNPAHPCWLMGYPVEWLCGGGSVTPSSRRLPPK